MRGNVAVILIAAVLVGLSVGVYDVVLPHWLQANGISYAQMGWIFALSNLVMMPLPILTGRLADLFGRKRVFASGLACCTVACGTTPATATVFGQMLLRLVQQAGTSIYSSLQGVLVFESSRSTFLRLIARTQGGEAVFTALGSASVLILLHREATVTDLSRPFYLAGGLLALALILVLIKLREPQKAPAPELTRRRFNPLALPSVLILLTAYNFIFQVGLSMSHSQMALLFFYDKFHLVRRDTAWINVVHRISFGLPMVLSTFLIRRSNKWVFAGTVVLEGIFISATALPRSVTSAVALWFFHDALGASIWAPMNQWYMQHYARPEHRASNVATVIAISALGNTVGPIVAGWMAHSTLPVPYPLSGTIDLPFFFSGAVVILSVIPLLFLPQAKTEPAVQ